MNEVQKAVVSHAHLLDLGLERRDPLEKMLLDAVRFREEMLVAARDRHEVQRRLASLARRAVHAIRRRALLTEDHHDSILQRSAGDDSRNFR
ncbi:MAG: hypothetical protein IPF82_19280 [Blastocatellia bacterium]|nr:hypothetical protein [Blastocatellia bacterium]